MLVHFELAAMTTPNLGQQNSIFPRLHLVLISEEVDLLVDCAAAAAAASVAVAANTAVATAGAAV